MQRLLIWTPFLVAKMMKMNIQLLILITFGEVNSSYHRHLHPCLNVVSQHIFLNVLEISEKHYPLLILTLVSNCESSRPIFQYLESEFYLTNYLFVFLLKSNKEVLIISFTFTDLLFKFLEVVIFHIFALLKLTLIDTDLCSSFDSEQHPSNSIRLNEKARTPSHIQIVNL